MLVSEEAFRRNGSVVPWLVDCSLTFRANDIPCSWFRWKRYDWWVILTPEDFVETMASLVKVLEGLDHEVESPEYWDDQPEIARWERQYQEGIEQCIERWRCALAGQAEALQRLARYAAGYPSDPLSPPADAP